MSWRACSIRGAITCKNTEASIREAVTELLKAIETRNTLQLSDVFNVIFSATSDLDQIFPAAIARELEGWDQVPLLDVQHMNVEGDLRFCIRCLVQFNTKTPEKKIHHIYLRQARGLRPDLCEPCPTD